MTIVLFHKWRECLPFSFSEMLIEWNHWNENGQINTSAKGTKSHDGLRNSASTVATCDNR